MPKKSRVREMAESLESAIDHDNLLNSRYNEQNFHMQKELLKHQKGLDKDENEDIGREEK